MKKIKRLSLSVIGCGKLGLPLIVCLADAGYSVLGIDTNPKLIQDLEKNYVSWHEPGLSELLKKNKKRITFGADNNYQFEKISTTFIIVPTPSNDLGEYSIDFVLSAIKSIGKKLSTLNFKSHTIVLVSTVMPGDTEGKIKTALKDSCGDSFEKISLCYSPEFIAIGSVISDLRNPDTILIGQPNNLAGLNLQKLLLSMVHNRPKIIRLNIIEAEIAKIAINSFVTTKISFSNQISEICEKVPGTSSVQVLSAIGADSRIGNRYLMQGTSYGGPCFPRDNIAFSQFANKLDVSLETAYAADKVNKRQTNRLLKLLVNAAPNASTVLLVGLAYKAETAVYEESPAIKLVNSATDYIFCAYDSHVKAVVTHPNLLLESKYALRNQKDKIDVAILFVPSSSYADIPDYLDKDTLLIDFWGLWEKYRGKQQYRYLKVGEYFERNP